LFSVVAVVVLDVNVFGTSTEPVLVIDAPVNEAAVPTSTAVLKYVSVPVKLDDTLPLGVTEHEPETLDVPA
jgi:hypothetical protein